MKQRTIVATAALPYANGDIHIGHLVEYVQADIWTRFQKMRGHNCLFICADDTHGTPIMLKAKELGITPEKFIEQSHQKHTQDFKDFGVEFDEYSTTHSPQNKKIAEEIYFALKSKGHLVTRMVDQLYDEKEKMFLPDRFVVGTCPKCQSPNQYGDSCEKCGATYSPMDLINPQSKVSGAKPVVKASEQVFCRLEDFREFLLEFIPSHTSKDVSKKLLEWFNEGLRDWDFSRDEPYFGFPIPGLPHKYFYVWFDAPIGYISSTLLHCERTGKSFDSFWRDPNSERYHFIGKDIISFHLIFWPCLLKASDYQLPNSVFVHGMLTTNGEKMSKSRGTFIPARVYLNHLHPNYLRFYYAAKMNSSHDDIDLNFEDFVQKVNSDFIGKITNLASRGAQMLIKSCGGTIVEPDLAGKQLLQDTAQYYTVVAEAFEGREFSKAMTMIRDLADMANKYFDENEPWKLVKTDAVKTAQVLSTVLHLFRDIAIYLSPVVPDYARKVEALFGDSSYQWSDLGKSLVGRTLLKYEHLAQRIEMKSVELIIEESKKLFAVTTEAAEVASQSKQTTDFLSIDEFLKVDLRVGKIIEADEVAGSDKLLKLKVDLGANMGQRQIFSGIKSSYRAEELVGRLVAVVANLAPRKMKFGVSEGMVVAAGDGAKIRLMSVDVGAEPGQRIQ